MNAEDPSLLETERCAWSQPFHWGLLTVFDKGSGFELPEGIGRLEICRSGTSLAVPVRHEADVEIPDDWPDDADLPFQQVEVRLVWNSTSADHSSQFDGIIP